MNYDPRIAKAFEAVLDRAKVDPATLALDGLRLSVEIDGKRYENTLKAAPTVERVRLALAEMLSEHCAIEAALVVIAEYRNAELQ